MNEKEKLHDIISFISVNRELNKVKKELNKAILRGNSDEIKHKREILEKVKETRDTYIK